ncbi:hypothetical protein D5Q97_23255 [Salmonella enterica]|uniref:16.5 kDa protein n=1 Tax=Salmonella enterica TaxID=28901 RepID=A0A5T9SMI0_SALER|nr:hypothetical protein [Salmonella enterica]
MDLNFLTGNPSQNAGGMSWLTGNNQNQNFSTPAMRYQPGMTLGDYTSPGTSTAGNSSMFGGASQGLGMNIPTFQLGLSALGSLANIYGGFQANRLAKDQLSFTKDITNTNLNNSIKSYNTALEDRARSRAVAENRDQSTADEYIEKNKLSR